MQSEATRGRDAHIYDEAIRFIEQHKGGPFYINVWSHISHHKVAPPQSYVDKFKDVVVDESKFAAPMREKFAICKARGGDVSEHMRRYLADIYSMDEDIGRLLKRVDELGLRENTIVVFSSDQGPGGHPAPARPRIPKRESKRQSDKTPSEDADARLTRWVTRANCAAAKHGMYEGGVRMPWIVRWPATCRRAASMDSSPSISGIDWLPTLCAIAGVKINAADFDGEDTSAAWLGKATHVPHQAAAVENQRAGQRRRHPRRAVEARSSHAQARRHRSSTTLPPTLRRRTTSPRSTPTS